MWWAVCFVGLLLLVESNKNWGRGRNERRLLTYSLTCCYTTSQQQQQSLQLIVRFWLFFCSLLLQYNKKDLHWDNRDSLHCFNRFAIVVVIFPSSSSSPPHYYYLQSLLSTVCLVQELQFSQKREETRRDEMRDFYAMCFYLLACISRNFEWNCCLSFKCFFPYSLFFPATFLLLCSRFSLPSHTRVFFYNHFPLPSRQEGEKKRKKNGSF